MSGARRTARGCSLPRDRIAGWPGTPDPSMRTPGGEVIRGRWGRSLFDSGLSEAFPADCVAVLLCCTVLGLVSCRMTARYTGDCRPAYGSRQVIPYAVL